MANVDPLELVAAPLVSGGAALLEPRLEELDTGRTAAPAVKPGTPPRVVSGVKVARALGMSADAVYAAMDCGEIASFRIGTRRFIPATVLAEIVERAPIGTSRTQRRRGS